METSVSRRCLQRRTAQMSERSQSLLQYYNNIASLQEWYSTDEGSHTPLQDDGDKSIETDSFQRWSWTSRRMCKLSATSERWTSLGTSHDERIMTAMARSKAMTRSNAKICEHWLTPNLARTFRPHGMRDDDSWREQTLFSGSSCVCTRELGELTQWIVWQESACRRASTVSLSNVSSAFSSRILHQKVQSARVEEC